MTEAEWLACENPDAMLRHLRGAASERKLRLFACACCRHVWHLVRDERLARAFGILERYADGAASDKQRLEAGRLARAVREGFWEQVGKENEVCVAGELWSASVKTLRRAAIRWGLQAATAAAWADVGAYNERLQAESANQCRLLRDIFGNPFRPVVVETAWLTADVRALAQGIYDERAFDRMPILADALQDAGCDNDEVLTHCRDAGPVHVRGCWVVDLLLGKS